MSRGILIDFPELDIKVKAKLLDQQAPKTCTWLWSILEQPVHNELLHVSFLGRGVTCRYTLPNQDRDLPPENLTITPAAGDIVLVNFTEQSGRVRGMVSGESFSYEPQESPGTYAGLDLFYGPDSRMFIPMGFVASPHCATVVENLEGLAKVGNLTRVEGVKKVIFSRIEKL